MWDPRVKRLTEKKKRSDSYLAERDGRPAQGVGFGGLKGTGRLGKTARLADRLGLGSTGWLRAAWLDGPKQRTRPNSSLSYRRVPRDSVMPPADSWVLPISERADLVRLARVWPWCACVLGVNAAQVFDGSSKGVATSRTWCRVRGRVHQARGEAGPGLVVAIPDGKVGGEASSGKAGHGPRWVGVRGQAKWRGLGPCSGRARVFAAVWRPELRG